jgi:hypothetical protein
MLEREHICCNEDALWGYEKTRFARLCILYAYACIWEGVWRMMLISLERKWGFGDEMRTMYQYSRLALIVNLIGFI